MRIGTWNVEYASGTEKNAHRLTILERHACDIWVLTETRDTLDLSATHAPLHSAQRPHGRPGERWVSIWSRFPILGSPKVVDPERTAAALIEAPSGLLLVFGTVLPWHSDRGKTPPNAAVRNWSEQHRILVQQSEEWAALQRLHPDAALCVAGDLNMNLGGPHYYGTQKGRTLLRQGMQCCNLFCATETDRIPSGALAYPPVDHILLPASWAAHTRVAAAWEGQPNNAPRLSDHSGLVVEVAD